MCKRDDNRRNRFRHPRIAIFVFLWLPVVADLRININTLGVGCSVKKKKKTKIVTGSAAPQSNNEMKAELLVNWCCVSIYVDVQRIRYRCLYNQALITAPPRSCITHSPRRRFRPHFFVGFRDVAFIIEWSLRHWTAFILLSSEQLPGSVTQRGKRYFWQPY